MGQLQNTITKPEYSHEAGIDKSGRAMPTAQAFVILDNERVSKKPYLSRSRQKAVWFRRRKPLSDRRGSVRETAFYTRTE